MRTHRSSIMSDANTSTHAWETRFRFCDCVNAQCCLIRGFVWISLRAHSACCSWFQVVGHATTTVKQAHTRKLFQPSSMHIPEWDTELVWRFGFHSLVLPTRILNLFTHFRTYANKQELVCSRSFISSCRFGCCSRKQTCRYDNYSPRQLNWSENKKARERISVSERAWGNEKFRTDESAD